METICLNGVMNDNSNPDLPVISMKKHVDEKTGKEYLMITIDGSTTLEEGNLVFFKRDLVDPLMNISDSLVKGYRILDKGLSPEDGRNTVLKIDFPSRPKTTVKKVNFPKNDGEPGDEDFLIEFHDNIDIIQRDLDEQDITMTSVDGYGDTIVIGNAKEEGSDVVEKALSIYSEENRDRESKDRYKFIKRNEIYCKKKFFDTDIIKGCQITFSGSPFLYEDPEHPGNYDLVRSWKTEGDEDGTAFSRLFYSNEYYSIPIPMGSGFSSGIFAENAHKKAFIEDIIQQSIPDYIDMEKQVFEPYYEDNGVLRKVKEINIYPHFRDRSNEGWNTDDSKYWAQKTRPGYWVNDENKEECAINKGDSLYSMNFMIDDVKNKKKKISKSFFRLSFFDADDPFNQMLLYYSTVFLNVNDMYSKLLKLGPEVLDIDLGEEQEKKAIEKYEKEMRCSCTVRNWNDVTNSSEGFYLYLFPEEYKNDGKTIYMKIEFNHAGVGKTIPLIDGNADEKFPPDDFIVENKDTKDMNVNIKGYFDSLYISVEAKYDVELDKYIYIIPEKFMEEDVANFNVFEPRINRGHTS